MTISANNKVSFSDIRAEYGPSGSSAMSISDYYSHSSGLPASGEIEMDDFRGETFDVVDVLSTTQTYAARSNSARFIHIYCVGGGGSGGASDVDRAGFEVGTASASGGAAGGVAKKILSNSQFGGNYSVTIGAGGAGVTSSANHFITGNAGGDTTFSGSHASLTGGGGGAGNAAERSSFGSDNSTSAASVGGTASGGSTNYTGGSGGQAVATTSETVSSSGGGGVNFVVSGSNDSLPTISGQTSAGGLASNDALPNILTSYISDRGQTEPVRTLFDGTDGGLNTSLDATFGAGSGGSSADGGASSGDGGGGAVIIVYEV